MVNSILRAVAESDFPHCSEDGGVPLGRKAGTDGGKRGLMGVVRGL